MKLKLTVEGGVQILTLTESISTQDVEIIKAGVGKLLKYGKNKIILEVEGSQTLPDEVIRDIGVLDNLARELSGRIIIVTAHELLKKRLDLFAKPPLVLCYSDRKSAIASLTQGAPLDENQKKIPTSQPQDLASVAARPFIASKAAASLLSKDEVMASELKDIGAVRKELAEMERENKILHDQLQALVLNRRQNIDSGGLTEKIRALELEVEKLLVPATVKKV